MSSQVRRQMQRLPQSGLCPEDLIATVMALERKLLKEYSQRKGKRGRRGRK
jgi:hypothetical protein